MFRMARDGTAKLSSSCSPTLGTGDESEAAWSALKAHFFRARASGERDLFVINCSISELRFLHQLLVYIAE